MAIQIGATQAKAKLLSLLDDVEAGEEIEITRHGRVIARLSPARSPKALRGMFAGIAWTNASDEELFSTGERWDIEDID
ncbi:MAG TPA: type II toxin-antitoxin system prevent-host-death family antitoxin [Chloroflexota bacterium]|nr:type II toxin-antitoxin system prevent-host-death family antitoxin [Chloroflexota bacterium]